MKRRGFLSMLGAAIAAPAMPTLAAPAARYSQISYGMAVLHARTRAHVSARGLSFCLKVPMAQAEAMLAEMAARGTVTRVGLGGSMRAVSNILQPQSWHVAAQATSQSQAVRKDAAQPTAQCPALPAWLRHVRQIARQHGHPLQQARLA